MSPPSPKAFDTFDVPPDFPAGPLNASYFHLRTRAALHRATFDHFGGAWHAIAYRFRALADYGQDFNASIKVHGAAPPSDERYDQEQLLFGLFSNAFSGFEAYFYGMHAVGAMLKPTDFSLVTPDLIRVTPRSVQKAYAKAFAGDAVLGVFDTVMADPEWNSLREIRNILTHRTAPGRSISVSMGPEVEPPTKWRLNDIVLDEDTAPRARKEVVRLLDLLLGGGATFITAHFP